jgi:hypothetical protein
MEISFKLLIVLFVLSTALFAQDNAISRDPINYKSDSIYQTRDTIQNKLVGGRSKQSIMSVVLVNLSEMRKIYNKRLRSKPGLEGKITFKFAIDEFGIVIFCGVFETTVNDNLLEKQLAEFIRKWKFEKIEKPGDVTEVIYPFVFKQENINAAVVLGTILLSFAIFIPISLLSG